MTASSPAVVCNALEATVATAPLRTTLVVIWKAMPLDWPSANGLPPLASATTSPVARIVAVWSAPTLSAPAEVTVMPVMNALAPPRTSFLAAAPAAAVASEAVTLRLSAARAASVSPTVTFLNAAFAAAVARFTTVPSGPVKR